ncbi:Sodium-coupled monocarboxylate transporter 1 [Brachionus plicatilis]|uniref:Sodium-coupled monocarboxylate transporter 1 n=1 Tax=Brachionus plicatilis TaxID=10195 RepID=A0A3M7SHI5_BRAPC|nr:Sodium-coupled monocarboxylate transporter 1 [Brachionus plicatilis]
MYWEQISFCVCVIGFIMLSSVKTIDKHRLNLKRKKIIKNLLNSSLSKEGLINQIAASGIVIKNEDNSEEKIEPYDGKAHFSKYLKVVINYCMTFNSAILVVGSLAESYFLGVRIMGNIIGISIGYIYAALVVHPLMYSLDSDIKTPYQYFERRYNNKKYVRAITALAAMLFYFFFLTLYLWGCAVLLSTLIPQVPLWVSAVLIGAYSIIGSTIGGFTQSTKTNVVQFLVLITGLIATLVLTITRHDIFDQSEIWPLASSNNRTVFFDTSVDFTTRYTILNQSVSIPLPWAYIHALFLPNFIRYRNIPGRKRSQFLLVSNLPFMALVNSILFISGGIFCFVYFYGCDPASSGKLVNRNQLGTYWILNVLSEHVPSFTGIVFASIIAYSVVQHSLGIALCGQTIFAEILKPMVFDWFSFLLENDSVIRWTKIFLTITLGILSTGLAITFQYLRNTLLSLLLVSNNAINAPLFGLYFLSAFNPYANHAGAMLAFVSNLAINLWLAFGTVVFSRLKSQDFAADISQCNSDYHSNMTALNVNFLSAPDKIPVPSSDSFYPKNPALAYLYSVAPIWYCMFSFLFMNIFGVLFSLAYSLLTTRSFDADHKHSEQRKKYLFYYRVFKMSNECDEQAPQLITRF